MAAVLDALSWAMTALGVVIGGLVGVVAVRILLGLAWDAFYERVIRPAIQVQCTVFIKSETQGFSRGEYVGTFWLPSIPRVGEKMIVPELKNPHDQTTHVMNGWLAGRVNKIQYAVEGGVPWHANICVDCDSIPVHE